MKGYVTYLLGTKQKARINEYMLFLKIPNKKENITAVDIGNDILSKCVDVQANRKTFEVKTDDSVGNNPKRFKVLEDDRLGAKESSIKRQKFEKSMEKI